MAITCADPEWTDPDCSWEAVTHEGVKNSDMIRIEGNTQWLKNNLDVEVGRVPALIRVDGTNSNAVGFNPEAIFNRTGQGVTLYFSAPSLPYLAANTGKLTIYLGNNISNNAKPLTEIVGKTVKIENISIPPGLPLAFVTAELRVIAEFAETWEGEIIFYYFQQEAVELIVNANVLEQNIVPFSIDYRSPF